MSETQPLGTIYQNNILPNALSQHTVSGGRNISHRYYLGPNNTVPFVRIEHSGISKEISWGEAVDVPAGQSASIRNVSYMPGDLQLQSGGPPVDPPRRITIPVTFEYGIKTLEESAPPDYLPYVYMRTKFPCDTRRARRAWLVLAYAGLEFNESYEPEPEDMVGPFKFIAQVGGQFQQHAATNDPISTGSSGFLPAAYVDEYVFEGETPRVIPLGESLASGTMRLVDYANVILTLEYNIDGLDEGANPALITNDGYPNRPHCRNSYYVVEY